MSNSASPSVGGNGVLGNEVTGTATQPAPTRVSTDIKKVATLDPATGKETPDTENGDADDSTTSDESKLPKRWRGKSETERVETFRTLESELGRKNNEIGQLRYAIDQMLQMRKNDDAASTASRGSKDKNAEPVTGERLLTDPDATIASVAERVVGEKHSETQARLDKLEFDRKHEQFAQKFPKYQETMGDEDFQDWVKASPLRQRLAATAAQHGSFDAAEELFSLYDESVVRVKEARVTSTDDTAKRAAADATLLKPGNGSTTSTGGAAKKTVSNANANKTIYKRAELATLYITDRDAYNAQMPDVMRAYREGRVR